MKKAKSVGLKEDDVVIVAQVYGPDAVNLRKMIEAEEAAAAQGPGLKKSSKGDTIARCCCPTRRSLMCCVTSVARRRSTRYNIRGRRGAGEDTGGVRAVERGSVLTAVS